MLKKENTKNSLYKTVSFEERKKAYDSIKDLDSLIDAFFKMGDCEKIHSISVKNEMIYVLNQIKEYDPSLLPENIKEENLILAAWFHDIGKLMIPSEILDKEGKLTKSEFLKMQKHSVYGYEVLNKIPEFKNRPEIMEIVLTHHEALNGSGYPKKLKEEEISFGAKLLRIIDSYDAIKMRRFYKLEKDIQEVKETLNLDSKQGKIDNKLFDFFISTILLKSVNSCIPQEKDKEIYAKEIKELLTKNNKDKRRNPKMLDKNIKFYYPEVGLDDSKTAEDHFKDLRYYMQDENIPAIEKIQEICEMMNMPFESDICKFAKESVEIDKAGDMPFNTGDLKVEIAEALKNSEPYHGEFDYKEDENLITLFIDADKPSDAKSIDDGFVNIILKEFNTENDKEYIGNGYKSFSEFKNMKPSGFDVEHGSIKSFINEISFYAIETEPELFEKNNIESTLRMKTENLKAWHPKTENKKNDKEIER